VRLNAVAGYRRPFATFADAAAAIAGYEGGGHTGPNYIALTVRDAKKARPADCPALFHIQRLLRTMGDSRLRMANKGGTLLKGLIGREQ
jgi:hypothetical protein